MGWESGKRAGERTRVDVEKSRNLTVRKVSGFLYRAFSLGGVFGDVRVHRCEVGGVFASVVKAEHEDKVV